MIGYGLRMYLWCDYNYFQLRVQILCGGKRRSYEQNQWIGINSAFYVYVYEQIYVVKYIYGSVALLSHFAKCKNGKCENKKCNIFYCISWWFRQF